MDISIFPIQPAAKKKSTPERFSRGKRGSPGSFSQVLNRITATQDRQDSFSGDGPHHRDTREELEDVLLRIR